MKKIKMIRTLKFLIKWKICKLRSFTKCNKLFKELKNKRLLKVWTKILSKIQILLQSKIFLEFSISKRTILFIFLKIIYLLFYLTTLQKRIFLSSSIYKWSKQQIIQEFLPLFTWNHFPKSTKIKLLINFH